VKREVVASSQRRRDGHSHELGGGRVSSLPLLWRLLRLKLRSLNLFCHQKICPLSTNSILLIGQPIESLLVAGVHVNAINSRYVLGGDQYPCWNLLPCNLGVAVILKFLIADSNCMRRVPNVIEEYFFLPFTARLSSREIALSDFTLVVFS